MYPIFFKRLFDLLLATVAFIFSLPIFLLIALMLLIPNKGSVFFIQIRPGKGGKPFKIVKFKTMNDRKDAAGNLLDDVVRLTKVGRCVRQLSLDEIPQLINVLKGDMSFIGPRPLLMEYLHLYDETQSKRHNVRPGITGWAQINGRNAISWEKKFELDVWYVENISFCLDSKILFHTVAKVFKKEGISSNTSVTMDKFIGT